MPSNCWGPDLDEQQAILDFKASYSAEAPTRRAKVLAELKALIDEPLCHKHWREKSMKRAGVSNDDTIGAMWDLINEGVIEFGDYWKNDACAGCTADNWWKETP